MNQRQLASVLFATVGVFIAASRLPEIFHHVLVLSQWSRMIEDPTDPFPRRLTAMALGSSLVVVLIGFGLIFLRERLASRLFPPETQPVTAREVQAIAFSVLGCYFVVQGLAGMSDRMSVRQFDWGGATQLVLGAALFFGGRGLSRLWSLARAASTSHNARGRAG